MHVKITRKHKRNQLAIARDDGNIARGYSISALGEKDVIKTLGPESWQAEVAARALIAKFEQLSEGEALELAFDVTVSVR